MERSGTVECVHRHEFSDGVRRVAPGPRRILRNCGTIVGKIIKAGGFTESGQKQYVGVLQKIT